MESFVSEAIIMRIREFGESDLIVTFFTPERGKLKGVARGGRKSRKRFANCLDLFCHAKLEYEEKRKSDLHSLNSCKLIHAFPGLRSDFTSLALASYLVELTDILFPQDVVAPEMFGLLCRGLFSLDGGMRPDLLRIGFESFAIALGGYKIDLDRCCGCGRSYTGAGTAVFVPEKGCIACLKCEKVSRVSPPLDPEAVRALRLLQCGPWQDADPMLLTDDLIGQIKTVLKQHIEYRVGKRLGSAKFLE
jgi:DNA repair protein RecO (recombination protein O)